MTPIRLTYTYQQWLGAAIVIYSEYCRMSKGRNPFRKNPQQVLSSRCVWGPSWAMRTVSAPMIGTSDWCRFNLEGDAWSQKAPLKRRHLYTDHKGVNISVDWSLHWHCCENIKARLKKKPPAGWHNLKDCFWPWSAVKIFLKHDAS